HCSERRTRSGGSPLASVRVPLALKSLLLRPRPPTAEPIPNGAAEGLNSNVMAASGPAKAGHYVRTLAVGDYTGDKTRGGRNFRGEPTGLEPRVRSPQPEARS